MDIRSAINDNPTAREDGVKVTYPGTDCVFILRSIRSRVFKRYQRDLVRKFRQSGCNEELDPDELQSKAIANAILAGWENVEVDGSVLEYTKANAEKLLSDPALDRLVDWLAEKATDDTLYQQKYEDDTVENLT